MSAAEQRIAAAGDSVRADIRALDTFENTWMPLVPLVIDHYVPAAQRAALVGAFFDGLSQQPEGPGVIDSVKKLVSRLADLAVSTTPGAKEAYESLVNKGLTAEVLSTTKATLARTETITAPTTPLVSETEQVAAAQRQRDAYVAVNAWFAEWAETLRPVFGYHDSVKLGLTQNRGGPGKPGVDEEEGAPTK